MADGGGEGGGSAEWQPIFDRVQAQAEALATDRARLEAASKVQRESWEAARRLQRSVEELQAAAREKDAETERLREEAADARKKMQADAGRRMWWETAYMELILGANQKLAELRDGDMEDSRICAETPNAKEVESCARLSQSTTDQTHIASDLGTELRKLKEACETLSSKKDKEVSAVLSEKDGEIGRLRAEAIGAKKKLQEMHSLVKEKDDEIQKLNGRHPESVEKRNNDVSEAHQKSRSDDPDATVRGKMENDGLRQMVEEDYIPETETVEKDRQGETTQKRRHASFRSNDDAQSGSDADGGEQSGRDKDVDDQSGHDEDGDQQTRSDDDDDDDDDDGQSRSNEQDEDEDEDEQSGREETRNDLVQNPFGRRTRNAFDAEVDDVKSHIESNGVAKRKCGWYPPPMPLRRRRLVIAHGQHYLISAGNWPQLVSDVKDSLADQPDKCREFVDFLVDFHYRRIGVIVKTMKVLLDGHPELIYRLNNFLPSNHQIKIKMEMKVKEEPQP